jgi:carboxypeptidase Q
VDTAAWQQAKRLIEEALSRPAADRRAFLASACHDAELRREVEAMLETYETYPIADHQTPGDETPPQRTQRAVPSSDFEFAPGFQAGPYVFVEPLGRGGGGEVHRARDTRLQRDVAIKILQPLNAAEGIRRVREARAAAQLNHRGIAAVYDIVEAGGRPCIVMEHVPGPSLAERLERSRPDLSEAIDVGIQIADAAAHAHASGIVHCDLKPANVKFAADGSVKVLDFGLARRSAGPSPRGANAVSGLTAASLEGLAIGTPGYMSPEQLLGLPIDVRTDVYSVGVILFEMATGARPFAGGDTLSTAVAVLSAPMPELPRRVPRRVRAVVQKSLSRAPDDRYPSAGALRDALAAVRPRAWRDLFDSIFRRTQMVKRVVPVLALVTAASIALGPVRADERINADMNDRIRHEEADRSQIMRTLHFLTDVYGPRLTGSPNLKAAGEWAIKQMESWGLTNGHLEPWEFGHAGWANERIDAHIVSPVKDSLTAEVLAWTPGTNGAVTASAYELDVPDRPTPAELTAFLATARDKVRGKIVLIGKRVIVPVNFAPPPKRRDDAQVKQQYDPTNPNAGAFGRGRGGDGPAPPMTPAEFNRYIDEFLVANGAKLRVNDAGREHGQIIAQQNRQYDVTKAVPTVILRNEDYGRISRILADGTSVELEFNVINEAYPEGRTAYNTIAEISGTDKRNEIVMLGGHLDSWHGATGATDNAIGCSIMMEAARILKAIGVTPRRTIRVALWSGEEEGLLGSQAYVREHFGSAENPKPEFRTLDAYLNVDSGTGRVRGAGVFGPPAAAQIVRETLAPFADLGVAGASATRSRNVGGTDHTSFNNAGLPGIGFNQDPIEYNTHTHHTNLDTYERIVEADVKQAATVIAAVLYQLAMRDEMVPRFSRTDMPALPVRTSSAE